MPLRKILEDSHGLYVRFDCQLYRPLCKTIFKEKTYAQIYQQDCNKHIKIMNSYGHIEEWKSHGPFKYDTGKYINTDRIWEE
jgi:hypothetical protein